MSDYSWQIGAFGGGDSMPIPCHLLKIAIKGHGAVVQASVIVSLDCRQCLGAIVLALEFNLELQAVAIIWLRRLKTKRWWVHFWLGPHRRLELSHYHRLVQALWIKDTKCLHQPCVDATVPVWWALWEDWACHPEETHSYAKVTGCWTEAGPQYETLRYKRQVTYPPLQFQIWVQ